MPPRATAIPESRTERERILKPYLPRDSNPAQPGPYKRNITTFSAYPSSKRGLSYNLLHPAETALSLIHHLLFFLIHVFFTLYITIRRAYKKLLFKSLAIFYHHHRTPELIQRDVQRLSRLPKHLSIILELEPTMRPQPKTHMDEATVKLVADAAEVATWSAAAGVPVLSLYERTGALKAALPALYEELDRTFRSYYAPGTEPEISLGAPHMPAHLNGHHLDTERGQERGKRQQLTILLLSETDGRETLVDLTKTLAEMAQDGRVRAPDVTQDLINAEVTAASCGEPDLVVVMAGGGDRERNLVQPGDDGSAEGMLHLRGYPPWPVRLSEIFYVQDIAGIDYQVFLRGLYKYAKAEFRVGR